MLQDKITISTLHHLLDYEAGKFISCLLYTSDAADE